MFNETTFKEILPPSSDNVNDFIVHVYESNPDLDWGNKNYEPRGEETAKSS